MLGSGAFWTFTYILMIRRGFLDTTYGMPLVALCANISWEFIFSFLYPHGPVQRPVNIVWFSVDLVILFQIVRYGPREFDEAPPGWMASSPTPPCTPPASATSSPRVVPIGRQ